MHEGRLPVISERHVMDDIEFYSLMVLPSRAKSNDLPQIIVKARSTHAFFPEAKPSGDVAVNPMNVCDRVRGQSFLDGRAIVGARNDPRLVKPGRLHGLIPANAWFGTLMRFAGVGRHQNP